MKIAIIGSRDYPKERVIDWLENHILHRTKQKYYQYITGGANGVDTYAEDWLRNINKTDVEVIRPINPENKLDYLFRNVEIITKADRIIVFWNGTSRGSKFVIDYAKARGKDIVIIRN